MKHWYNSLVEQPKTGSNIVVFNPVTDDIKTIKNCTEPLINGELWAYFDDICPDYSSVATFKQNDYVIGELGNIYKIIDINYETRKYVFKSSKNTKYVVPFLDSYKYILWTIESAQHGDLLVDKFGNIGRYDKMCGMCWHSDVYTGVNTYCIYETGSHYIEGTHPADDVDVSIFNTAFKHYEFDKLRSEYNEKCLNILIDYMHEYPEQRFMQALNNLGLSDKNFNEEPNTTYNMLIQKK